ncbi:unnamed protein product [Calypogeia fissa]
MQDNMPIQRDVDMDPEMDVAVVTREDFLKSTKGKILKASPAGLYNCPRMEGADHHVDAAHEVSRKRGRLEPQTRLRVGSLAVVAANKFLSGLKPDARRPERAESVALRKSLENLELRPVRDHNAHLVTRPQGPYSTTTQPPAAVDMLAAQMLNTGYGPSLSSIPHQPYSMPSDLQKDGASYEQIDLNYGRSLSIPKVTKGREEGQPYEQGYSSVEGQSSRQHEQTGEQMITRSNATPVEESPSLSVSNQQEPASNMTKGGVAGRWQSELDKSELLTQETSKDWDKLVSELMSIITKPINDYSARASADRAKVIQLLKDLEEILEKIGSETVPSGSADSTSQKAQLKATQEMLPGITAVSQYLNVHVFDKLESQLKHLPYAHVNAIKRSIKDGRAAVSVLTNWTVKLAALQKGLQSMELREPKNCQKLAEEITLIEKFLRKQKDNFVSIRSVTNRFLGEDSNSFR